MLFHNIFAAGRPDGLKAMPRHKKTRYMVPGDALAVTAVMYHYMMMAFLVMFLMTHLRARCSVGNDASNTMANTFNVFISKTI
jgi:hypothetical protein